jgi:hypothetical protein
MYWREDGAGQLFFSFEEHPAGSRMPLYSKRGIVLVNEIFVRFEGHPWRSPLFFGTHVMIVK